MREAAVMLESKDRAFESSEDVEIRRLGCQRHGRGGERGPAVEPGARQAGSGQEMGERLHLNLVTQGSYQGMPSGMPYWPFLATRL